MLLLLFFLLLLMLFGIGVLVLNLIGDEGFRVFNLLDSRFLIGVRE